MTSFIGKSHNIFQQYQFYHPKGARRLQKEIEAAKSTSLNGPPHEVLVLFSSRDNWLETAH
jgi:hypothetical protein